MFKIMNAEYVPYKTQVMTVTPSFNRTIDMLRNDLEKVTEYYKHSSKILPNSHTLVRLVKELNIHTDSDIYRLMSALDYKVKYTVKRFDFASAVSYGQFDDNVLYVSVDLYDNYFNLGDWRDITPIRTILTDSTNIQMPHPEDDKDIRICLIDVKALAIQYYHAYKEEELSVSSFLYRYPLTNSIASSLDLAIVNNFFLTPKYYKDTHPFYITPRINEVLRATKGVKKYMNNKDLEVASVLSSIPTLNNNGLTVMQFNIPYVTAYNMLPLFYIYSHFFFLVSSKATTKKKMANSALKAELMKLLSVARSTRSLQKEFYPLTSKRDMLVDYIQNY